MKKGVNIEQILTSEKRQTSKEDQLLAEAKKILIQNKLSDENILGNLKFYNSSFEFLDEEENLSEKTFTQTQLKSVCKKLHLRCLPSQAFEGEVPYEAVLKIKELNTRYHKDLKHFKILSTKEFFSETYSKHQAVLFAQTLYGSYYLIHTWGEPLSNWRKPKYFILRNFESLAAVMLLFTLIECLVIPDRYLSTDPRATYFSLYRAAAYFHLLILNTGLTIFLLFAFHLSFSENNWDSPVRRKNL
jgi:hypothetical protein